VLGRGGAWGKVYKQGKVRGTNPDKGVHPALKVVGRCGYVWGWVKRKGRQLLGKGASREPSTTEPCWVGCVVSQRGKGGKAGVVLARGGGWGKVGQSQPPTVQRRWKVRGAPNPVLG